MDELEEVRAKVQPEKIRTFISQKSPESSSLNWVKTKVWVKRASDQRAIQPLNVLFSNLLYLTFVSFVS